MKKLYVFSILFVILACGLALKVKLHGVSSVVQSGRTPESIEIPGGSASDRAMDSRLFEIHRKWVGTPWNFSGTSQVAGQGSIACGYFVTTTLREVGLDVDRVRLAQAASETMILEITDPASVRRFSDSRLDNFISTIQQQGEGYYIVGLDDHTGFLKVDRDGGVLFIHSGPGKGVVIETPKESQKLASSRYRVTGKIKWSSGE